MANLLCHLHFWTLKALSPRTGTGSDIGTHTYHDKITTSGTTSEDTATSCRREWAEGRGITWTPRNKPDRLRARLRECEELLSLHAPVFLKWRALRHCLLLLRNGVLITFTVARHSGDIERLTIDKSLVTRLPSNIDAAVIGENTILLSLADDHRPAILSLQPKKLSGCPLPLALTQTDSGRKLEKLSNVNPELHFAHVRGLPVTGTWKHIRLNNMGDLAVFWWRERSPHIQSTHNMILFTISSGQLEYVSGVHTDHQPVDIQFSKNHYHKLYCLEKADRSTYLSSTYECGDSELTKKSTDAEITVSGRVVVCERSTDETKLLLACEDGTVVLQDVTTGGKTYTTQTFIKPISLIRWHPAGAFAIILSSRGELQAYDLGLNPLQFLVNAEELSPTPILRVDSHILGTTHLMRADWGSGPREGEGHGGCYDNFIMVFENGPIVLLRLELGVLSRGCVGPVEMVCEYLRLGEFNKAIQMLCRLSWSSQSLEAYSALSLILNHILKLPLTAETMAKMEASLATFLTPERPFSHQIYTAHKESVFNLARRYFFLLLRNGCYEKCLELGKQIEARDLVMDVHFRAVQLGNDSLAEKAKHIAEQISLKDQLEDPLRRALCGRDMTTDQLEFLKLLCDSGSTDASAPQVLEGWEELGQPRDDVRLARDRLAPMKFDTSSDYSCERESMKEMQDSVLEEEEEGWSLDGSDFEKTPNVQSQPEEATTFKKTT